jgi:hypothetical protein
VLVAAFGAGFVDAMAGGGGLIQLPALFAAFPQFHTRRCWAPGKLAGFAGTTSSIFRFMRPRAPRLAARALRSRRRVHRSARRCVDRHEVSTRAISQRWCQRC